MGIVRDFETAFNRQDVDTLVALFAPTATYTDTFITATRSSPALATVDGVRANTAALIRRLPDEAWARAGRHTESGRYTAEDWLKIYADHLEGHARQIEKNVALWKAVRAR